MWVILVVAVVVVVGVVVVAVQRRPKGSDLSSVRKYHSALGTIEHLSDRIGKAPVRVVGGGEPVGGDADAGITAGRRSGGIDRTAGEVGWSDTEPGWTDATPGANRRYPPVSGDADPNDREAPLVFDDARPEEHRWRDGSAHGPSRSRTDRAQRHALESMNRRPRRGVAVMIVLVAVATFAVLAFLGSRRSNSGPGHSAAASTSTVRATHSTSSSVPGSGGSHPGGHAGKHSGKTKPTPTTLPPQIVATSTGPGVATYSAPADSYNVMVTATGPCWVLARTVSSGSTLWTGTLQAGGAQSIQAIGAITVELGAASATLSVDNVPVALPTPLDTPFEATFQPGIAGAPSPGSATSTTAATG